MNEVSEKIIGIVSEWDGKFDGAYNIREDGKSVGRQSSGNIKIENKKDGPGLLVNIAPGTHSEKVYIPACVTHSKVEDLAYNDFFIGEGADVTIIAGCGVHADGEEDAAHNGVHRFFVGKGAHVVYKEKHIGIGEGKGLKRIDPATDIELQEDAVMEIDTVQIGGVDTSNRVTNAKLAARAKLIINERLLTSGQESANTDFSVELNGEDSGVDLISRSVARDDSHQEYRSRISGNNRSTGHSECDAILVGNGKVTAVPELFAKHIDAMLIHEAAIGKIAGEQILKLRTLGLTEEEAEARIINGFIRG